jgi:glucose/mannose-6-phosphate isomerase
MANIDNIEEINKIDQDGYLKCIQEFPEQCERAWQDWEAIPIPARFVQAKNILITGMGGSGIAGALVRGMAPEVSVPVGLWQDYGVPGWVNRDTLVIAISYSGNTEETLDSFKKAAEKTDRLITLAKGGELEVLSRKYKTCHYKINYEGQPRASFGFMFTSIAAIFNKLKLIEISGEDFSEAIILLKALLKKIDANVFTSSNRAKIISKKLYEKIPVVFGSGIMAEMARRWCNEFGENSKAAAYYQVLPEMNHNTFNGVQFPKELGKEIFCLVLQSNFDHPRNKIRQNVTMEILQKNRIPYENISLESAPTVFSEMLQFTLMGAYVSYYLALLYDIDPTVIKVVDYLKERLAEFPIKE